MDTSLPSLSGLEPIDLSADIMAGQPTVVLDLAATDAWVWWVPIREAEDEMSPQWQALEALLSEDELERASRFQFATDRQTYIAAHSLGRLMLSRATGAGPDFWRFDIGERGKPEVVPSPDLPRLRLNLSHTRGLVAAALTRDRDIGVDVERAERNTDIGLVAKRVFCAAECEVIFAGGDAAERLQRFLRFWTLKEAYVKAIGKGLTQPLKRIAFDLGQPDRAPQVRFDGAGDADPDWQFAQVSPTAETLLALALHDPDATRKIHIRQALIGLRDR